MNLIVILLFAFFLRLIGSGQSFWLDEAAQVIESVRPLGQQLDIKGDFWPPLYHLVLHFWMYIDTSEIWVRLLTVIIGVVSVFFTYHFAKIMIDKKVALLSAFLLAISPFHIWYSQEARPYMLSLLLGVLATFFLTKKQMSRYSIASAFFMYSSYMSIFLLSAHFVYVLLFEKEIIKNWFKSIAVAFFFFIPWLPFFADQLTIGQSLTITLPGWSDAVSTPLYKALPLVFIKFVIGRISIENKLIYSSLSVLLFSLISYLTINAYKLHKVLVLKLLALIGIPVISAFLVSVFLPVLAPQRVLFVLPFFYILISFGIYQLKRYSYISLGLIIVVSVYSIFLYWTNPLFQREKWREVIHFIESTALQNSRVVFVFPDAFAPWQWYEKGLVKSLSIAPTFTVKTSELHEFDDDFTGISRVYYFYYLTDLTDPDRLSINYIEKMGFRETQKKDYPGVGFISLYEKNYTNY